jgi:hypothetical protein
MSVTKRAKTQKNRGIASQSRMATKMMDTEQLSMAPTIKEEVMMREQFLVKGF